MGLLLFTRWQQMCDMLRAFDGLRLAVTSSCDSESRDFRRLAQNTMHVWIVGGESLLRSSHVMPELSTKAPSSELVFYCSPAWPYQKTPIIIEMRLKICLH